MKQNLQNIVLEVDFWQSRMQLRFPLNLRFVSVNSFIKNMKTLLNGVVYVCLLYLCTISTFLNAEVPINSEPDKPEVRSTDDSEIIKRARQLYLNEDYEQALKCFMELQPFGKDATTKEVMDSSYGVMFCYLRLGKYDEAEHVMEVMYDKLPFLQNDIDFNYTFAMLSLRCDNYGNAVFYLTKTIDIINLHESQEHAEDIAAYLHSLHFVRGAAYATMQKRKEALADFEILHNAGCFDADSEFSNPIALYKDNDSISLHWLMEFSMSPSLQSSTDDMIHDNFGMNCKMEAYAPVKIYSASTSSDKITPPLDNIDELPELPHVDKTGIVVQTISPESKTSGSEPDSGKIDPKNELENKEPVATQPEKPNVYSTDNNDTMERMEQLFLSEDYEQILKCIAELPHVTLKHLFLSMSCYLRLGKYHEAERVMIETYNKCSFLRNDIDHVAFKVLIAMLSLKCDNYGNAVFYLTDSIDIINQPENKEHAEISACLPLLHHMRGGAYATMQKRKEALADLEIARNAYCLDVDNQFAKLHELVKLNEFNEFDKLADPDMFAKFCEYVKLRKFAEFNELIELIDLYKNNESITLRGYMELDMLPPTQSSIDTMFCDFDGMNFKMKAYTLVEFPSDSTSSDENLSSLQLDNIDELPEFPPLDEL